MKHSRIVLPALIVLFLALNILFPAQAVAGAKQGLSIFLQTVLPALLPFFAVTTMLVRTGLAHRAARLLSPLMRPLFHLPGASALAFVIACFGGNPNGSRITSELYAEGLLTKTESERTIALASTAGPAFILSVVAGEMLRAPEYGFLLWICHVLSAIATCQISSLFVPVHAMRSADNKPSIRAAHQVHSQIFIESVRDCAMALWGVGAFIIFFSTLTTLFQSVHLFAFLAKPFALVLKPLGFSTDLAEPFLRGIMEITDGCNAVSALPLSVSQKLPILCAIMSFGGCSALAQNYLFARNCGMRLSRLTLYYSIQGTIGLFITTVAVRFIPIAQPAYAPVPHAFNTMFLGSAGYLLTAIAVLAGLGAVLTLFSYLSKKNNKRHGVRHIKY